MIQQPEAIETTKPPATATPSPTADPLAEALARIDARLAEIGMVDLSRMDQNWVIELRYAGENNFVGRVLYPVSVCLLAQGSAEKLIKAQALCEERGLRLKIWDAYRPSAYQYILYDAAEDKSFVANPKRGSKHSRGAAVDVTLVDAEGRELLMPTDHDSFTASAALNDPSNTGEAKKNGELLRNIMVEAGFKPISTEWWHFDDVDWEQYPLTDYDLTEFVLPV